MSGSDESQEMKREETCPVMSALPEHVARAAGLIEAFTFMLCAFLSESCPFTSS